MLDEKQNISVRKHAASIFGKLGLRSGDFEPHQLEWKVLNSHKADVVRSARTIIEKLESSRDEAETSSLESAHNGLMAIFDDIEHELDIRTQIGDRGARKDKASPFLPIPGGTEARGQDDGQDYETSARVPGAYSLRSGQSMAEYVRANGFVGETYRGLTEGAFLRSMVVGPKTDLEKRALAEGTDSAGGYTVPDILSARLIDRLRAASVVFRAGAQTVPLTSDRSSIAKLAADPVPAWRNENAAVNDSDPTFAAVTLVPRSLAVLVKVSRELLEDSLNLETALPQILASALAAEVDRVALVGTGVEPQPKGVNTFVAKTANTFAGGVPGYLDLVRAQTALRVANSDATAFILHPRDEGTLAVSLDGEGRPFPVPPAIAEVPRLTTTALPTNLGAGTNESVIFAGDWSKLLIGVRSALRVEILRERYADNLQYGFLAHLRVDVAAEHEAAFTVMTKVATA